MASPPELLIARRARAILISACLITLFAMTIAKHVVAENAPILSTSNNTKTTSTTNGANLQWNNLTPAQQFALAPLAVEWKNMGPIRKEKWLKIANKFSSMKSDEQLRAQEKMREWIKLTPEQRQTVRENYARAKKLAPTQKTEKWEQYQQLPEEKKKNLAGAIVTKKQVTNLPSSSQSTQKTIQPIKTGPKIIPKKTAVLPNQNQPEQPQPPQTPTQ